jgi:hypothetical protein
MRRLSIAACRSDDHRAGCLFRIPSVYPTPSRFLSQAGERLLARSDPRAVRPAAKSWSLPPPHATLFRQSAPITSTGCTSGHHPASVARASILGAGEGWLVAMTWANSLHRVGKCCSRSAIFFRNVSRQALGHEKKAARLPGCAANGLACLIFPATSWRRQAAVSGSPSAGSKEALSRSASFIRFTTA